MIGISCRMLPIELNTWLVTVAGMSMNSSTYTLYRHSRHTMAIYILRSSSSWSPSISHKTNGAGVIYRVNCMPSSCTA